jgi:hypothetical protein
MKVLPVKPDRELVVRNPQHVAMFFRVRSLRLATFLTRS